jgi:hypothetical protein
MVIRQPASDTMWEFFGMRKRADGWHAKWGGRMDKVSANPGHFEEPHPDWGATATSLPLLGGLITIEEARKGRIDHALAFALPQTRAGVHAWPAQRSDGVSRRPGAIPEGTRFRLDPELDVESLGLPALTRLMAEAAQRHGIVLRDQSGAVTFYGEDPTPTGRSRVGSSAARGRDVPGRAPATCSPTFRGIACRRSRAAVRRGRTVEPQP